VTEAEQTLAQRDRIYDLLRETHDSGSQLLRDRVTVERQLGEAEATGTTDTGLKSRLAELDGKLTDQRRRRQGAIQTLLVSQAIGQTRLLSLRSSLETAKAEFTASVVSAHRARYDAVVAELQRLQCEADALGEALRVSVSLPVPARVLRHPDVTKDGTIAPLELIRDNSTISLPAGVQRVAATLSRLDSALSLCSSIARCRSLDGIRDRRQSSGDQAGSITASVDGVFEVAAASLVCGLDSLSFAKGDYVDQFLLGAGPLGRCVSARVVRRVDRAGATVGSAA
jgi:hypothetical protein